MSDLIELRQEAEDALEHVWFIASLEEVERTDITLSLRLHIRRDLFVQVFSGVTSGSLYMALIVVRVPILMRPQFTRPLRNRTVIQSLRR